MKTLIFTIGIAIILGLGAIYLYATPQARVRQAVPAAPPAASAPIGAPAWATYQNPTLGFSIDYPNDGTYTAVMTVNQGKLPHLMYPVEPPPVIGFLVTIGQSATLFTDDTVAGMEQFQIYVTPDSHILTTMPVGLAISSTKLINGLLFKQLTSRLAAGNLIIRDCAYAIGHNGRYYVFQSTRGDDPIFEQMMASLKFD